MPHTHIHTLTHTHTVTHTQALVSQHDAQEQELYSQAKSAEAVRSKQCQVVDVMNQELESLKQANARRLKVMYNFTGNSNTHAPLDALLYLWLPVIIIILLDSCVTGNVYTKQ